MEISPSLLLKLLFCSFLLGVALSLANRAARELFLAVEENNQINRGPKSRRVIAVLKRIYVFAADILLLTVCAAGIIILCYYFNYGEIRGFCILGTGLGYLLSYVSIERLFRLFIRALARAFVKLFVKILVLAFTPIVFCMKICKILFKKVKIYVISALEKKEKVLYNNNELLYIYKLSQKGFLNNGSKKD